MIKFVIGLIALIFVALAAYVYTGQKGEEVTKSAITHDVVKKEVTESKVEKPEKVAKDVKVKEVLTQDISHADLLVKDAILFEKQNVNQENNIGKGLTPESIESANVTDKEKELLYSDLAYRDSINNADKLKPMTEKEALELIEEDSKNGILK